MPVSLRPDRFRDWARLCVEALAGARAEIDALNVFPVPDADTGTNTYLTFLAGAEAIDAGPASERRRAEGAENGAGPGSGDAPETMDQVVAAYTEALLLSAKGNSGVICSQLVRAGFGALEVDRGLDADALAAAFEAAARAAYEAVGAPVEGTILSVAAAAAEAAREAAEDGESVERAIARASGAARAALEATPRQLERLARAGVVDAGGRALVVVVEATEQALTGRIPPPAPHELPIPALAGDDLSADGPAYEVMYLLEADDERLPALRQRLAGLGDSLVVVGGDRLWNVHVHVDDVGAAIEAGLAAGRPYRIAVTHFADQIARPQPAPGRVVVAATTGPGLASLCREVGAHVLEFDRSTPLTAAGIHAAIRATGSAEVIALPNAPRHVDLFEAAAAQARRGGQRIAVIPSHAQVQGLAALAVHDPGRSFDDAVVAMSSAAAHTQHGALTVATEPGMTMGGPCAAGDVLGVVEGDFALVGADLGAVARQVAERLLTPSAELVTLVVGRDTPDDLAETLAEELRRDRVDVDVVVYRGDQDNYPLFLAVE